MNLLVIVAYIACIMGITLPSVYCYLIDKKYEQWKKNNGYVNNYKSKGLFRDFKDMSKLKKALSYIMLYVPGINLILEYNILHRRENGITLYEEINMGTVSKVSDICDNSGDTRRTHDETLEYESTESEQVSKQEELVDSYSEMIADIVISSLKRNKNNDKNNDIFKEFGEFDDEDDFDIDAFFDKDKSGPKL